MMGRGLGRRELDMKRAEGVCKRGSRLHRRFLVELEARFAAATAVAAATAATAARMRWQRQIW